MKLTKKQISLFQKEGYLILANFFDSREVEALQKELSRQSEMIADNNAAKMMINAGFAKETCLNEITFIAEKMQWDADTDIESTHPGYLERFKSLQNFLAKYNKSNKLG